MQHDQITGFWLLKIHDIAQSKSIIKRAPDQKQETYEKSFSLKFFNSKNFILSNETPKLGNFDAFLPRQVSLMKSRNRIRFTPLRGWS